MQPLPGRRFCCFLAKFGTLGNSLEAEGPQVSRTAMPKETTWGDSHPPSRAPAEGLTLGPCRSQRVCLPAQLGIWCHLFSDLMKFHFYPATYILLFKSPYKAEGKGVITPWYR